MPLAELKEIHNGRDFGEDEDSREYTRIWMARTTLKHDEGFVINEAAALFGFPKIGTKHNKDSKARCISRSGNNSSGPYWWTLTAGYSTDFKKKDNPLEDDVIVTWDDVFGSEQTQKDAAGEVMLNTAKDTFDTPYPISIGNRQATLKFNLDGENVLPLWTEELQSDPVFGRHSLNDNDVIIDQITHKIRTVRCERIAVGEVKERNDIKFRECVARLSVKKFGWDIERIDEGYREVIPVGAATFTRVKIRDKSGALIAKPAALDGNGKALELEINGELSRDPVLLKFSMYPEDDHTQIPGVTSP